MNSLINVIDWLLIDGSTYMHPRFHARFPIHASTVSWRPETQLAALNSWWCIHFNFTSIYWKMLFRLLMNDTNVHQSTKSVALLYCYWPVSCPQVSYPTDGLPWGVHITGPYPDGVTYLISYQSGVPTVGPANKIQRPDTSKMPAFVRLQNTKSEIGSKRRVVGFSLELVHWWACLIPSLLAKRRIFQSMPK